MSLLPTEKSKPLFALGRKKILIYGPSKIGKSDFCSNFKDAFFIATEEGLDELEVYKTSVSTWEEFLEICNELNQTDRFPTVVIDTADLLYQYCSNYILSTYQVRHESDLDWGKGWSEVKKEFERVLNKISKQGRGLIFISHGREIEIKNRTGTHTRFCAVNNKPASQVILPLVDMILRFGTTEIADINGETKPKRMIFTKPDEFQDAGGRGKVWAKMPDMIPLDYETFISTYEKNQLKEA